MSSPKRRRLESTVAALQQRYGAQAVRKATELPARVLPPHLTTGFVTLDALTGCNGIPLGAISLLSGAATTGIVTVAYKVLLHAQRAAQSQRQRYTAAIVDVSNTLSPGGLLLRLAQHAADGFLLGRGDCGRCPAAWGGTVTAGCHAQPVELCT